MEAPGDVVGVSKGGEEVREAAADFHLFLFVCMCVCVRSGEGRRRSMDEKL